MAQLKGKTVKLTPSQGGQDVDVIRLDGLPIDRPVTLLFRLEPNPVPALWVAGVLSAQVLLKVSVITGIGVTVQRNAIVPATNLRTLRIVGAKSIVVTAALISANNGGQPYPATQAAPAAGTSASVTVLASDENIDVLGEDFPVWNPLGDPVADYATTAAGGPGRLLDVTGVVTNLAGAAAIYLWLKDSQDLFISGFTVTNGGTGYTSQPTMTLSFGTGVNGYSQAPTALPLVATIAAGVITAINFPAGTVQDFRGAKGLGITDATLTITGGGGANAAATPTIASSSTRYALPVIGPFTTVPQAFSFEDELKDAAFFEAGLTWALSSDPYTFTLVTGARARVDVKVAQ